PPRATTDPRIFSIVLFDTPARARSSTEAYGRPSMIFFAVALPTPGSASRSAAEAVFRSTGPVAAAFSALELEGFSELDAVSDLVVFSSSDFLAEPLSPPGFLEIFPRPAFAGGLSFSIVASDTPARERSLMDEYGRPAMIFAAVAAPMPGS